MNALSFLQTHRRSILFLLTLLSIAGIITAFKVPVALFPAVEFPRVVVSVDAGDMPAERMLVQIIKPAEEAIKQVPGIQNIRSTTSRGSAGITINFAWGSNMSLKALQINNALNRILPILPPNTLFNTRQMDPSVFPILGYSLRSKTLSLVELKTIAQYQLTPLLSDVPGVSQVVVVGGKQAEYHVSIIPERLQALGLSIQNIIQTLSANNVITAVGRLEANDKLYLLVANAPITQQKDIENIVIPTSASTNATNTIASIGSVIRLKDIASVTLDTVPEWISVNADGQEAVLLQIFQQPDGNSVQIARSIAQKLKIYRPQLPQGIKLAKWYDQSQLVTSAADSVRNAIIIGTLLAAFILWIFLRNLKITWIAIFVVPASLSITILILYAAGQSFNMMTLGGMAAAIGLIIDDAIVMLEHIISRLRANPEHYHQRIISAALEFFQPLLGSSAATTIIFIPLAFLSGVTGAFFKALSFTMASALILSFLVTWLAVPLLADHLLKTQDTHHEERGKLTEYCHYYYTLIMQKLLSKPSTLLWGLIPLMAAGYIAYQQTGSGFMPSMDEHGFVIDYRTPPGTALSETVRLMSQIENIIKHTAGVQSYSRRTGVRFGGADSFSEANEGDISVHVDNAYPTEEVMSNIRQQLKQQVPGINIEIVQLMEDMIGDLTAVPQPIEIKIYTAHSNLLNDIAKKVAVLISHIPGVVDINNGITPSGDAMMIQIDPIKAAIERVDPSSVTQLLSSYITGQVATQLPQGDQWVGLRVLTPDNFRRFPHTLLDIMLPAPDGHLYPLKRIASLEIQTGQAQITRENLKRMVAVTARISGRDMGSVIKDIRNTLDKSSIMTKGNYYELGGLYQEQQSAFQALILVLITAFFSVFLLQLFLYESFCITISIMCLPLFALSAVFLGLWISNTELNISSMMGMTMIIGIITEVAIFYFSEYQHLIETESPLPALIQAGKNRMRPIMMTTLAAILALAPLALDLSHGASMEQPLAIAIIAGLIIQIPLVLLVMPTLYYVLSKRKMTIMSS